jgi:C4-type Zn-finger protein
VSNQQQQHQQQKFECPSCRKQFPYGPQDFDQWFEHIRYCENKP